MSYSGEIYVEVDASVLNPGISPMATISGNPEPIDGSATVVVYILWYYDSDTGEGGFSGNGWFFDDEYSYLDDYFQEYDRFINWLKETKTTDLSDVLAGWLAQDKADFLNKYLSLLESGGCLWFASSASST